MWDLVTIKNIPTLFFSPLCKYIHLITSVYCYFHCEPRGKLQKLCLQHCMVVWQSATEEKKPLASFSLSFPYPGYVHLQVNLAKWCIFSSHLHPSFFNWNEKKAKLFSVVFFFFPLMQVVVSRSITQQCTQTHINFCIFANCSLLRVGGAILLYWLCV